MSTSKAFTPRSESTGLAFTYQRDRGDDFAWLSVNVRTRHFAGEGGFWVQWQDLERLGCDLRAYPITEEHPVSAEWGYGDLKSDKTVSIVGFKVAPADVRGNLLVSVELVNEDTSERLRANFRTNYPQVESFAAELARIASEPRIEAVLEGGE